MNEIDASAIDLNLLVALDALLRSRSVTRAARRLGVGQSAASHALARLRKQLGDPLLVRSGREMVPTPRAELLREPLARLLADAARLVTMESAFEPETTNRTFVLACPDILAPVVGQIAAALGKAAPLAQLEVVARQHAELSALEDGRCDVLLSPTPQSGPGLVCQGLGKLRFGVVARMQHPALTESKRLTKRIWAAYPHVMVRGGHSGRSVVGERLEALGFSRRVGLVVPTFLAALVAASQSDSFFTVPRELAVPLTKALGLQMHAPPVSLPTVPVAAVWHERFGAEPAHRFFRRIVVAQFRASRRSC